MQLECVTTLHRTDRQQHRMGRVTRSRSGVLVRPNRLFQQGPSARRENVLGRAADRFQGGRDVIGRITEEEGISGLKVIWKSLVSSEATFS
jgi:hypothetical protein